jgi:hypothetical protein
VPPWLQQAEIQGAAEQRFFTHDKLTSIRRPDENLLN